MIQIDTQGVGRRIAKYRKMNGISAAQLAEDAGAGLSRAIVANLESGRREDIGVGALTAIAQILGVPLVALLFPVDEPERNVDPSPFTPTTAFEAIEWAGGHSRRHVRTPAGKQVQAVLVALRDLERVQREVEKIDREARYIETHSSEPAVAEWSARVTPQLLALRDQISEKHLQLAALDVHFHDGETR